MTLLQLSPNNWECPTQYQAVVAVCTAHRSQKQGLKALPLELKTPPVVKQVRQLDRPWHPTLGTSPTWFDGYWCTDTEATCCAWMGLHLDLEINTVPIQFPSV